MPKSDAIPSKVFRPSRTFLIAGELVTFTPKGKIQFQSQQIAASEELREKQLNLCAPQVSEFKRLNSECQCYLVVVEPPHNGRKSVHLCVCLCLIAAVPPRALNFR